MILSLLSICFTFISIISPFLWQAVAFLYIWLSFFGIYVDYKYDDFLVARKQTMANLVKLVHFQIMGSVSNVTNELKREERFAF